MNVLERDSEMVERGGGSRPDCLFVCLWGGGGGGDLPTVGKRSFSSEYQIPEDPKKGLWINLAVFHNTEARTARQIMTQVWILT